MQARKFDWTSWRERDTTNEWDKFTPFLASHGVFLFETEAYLRVPLAPSSPALSPFLPTRDQDFVYRPRPCTYRPKHLYSSHPLCRMGFDSLGREVCVKAVERKSHEWQILEFLTSPTLRRDRANHTIPIVSVLHHHDGETVFIVQAKWGTEWLIPNLETMKELYAVTRQLLEGLAFMHRHGVGHGDLHSANIVWNFHNTRIGKNAPDYKKFQRDFDFRLGFIDFGAAVRFPNRSTNHSIPCRPDAGPCAPYRSPEQDQEEGKTFDLFAADVYALAQILITECKPFIDDEIPLEYSMLLEEMTALEPSRRPSAQAALTRLQAIIETHM